MVQIVAHYVTSILASGDDGMLTSVATICKAKQLNLLPLPSSKLLIGMQRTPQFSLPLQIRLLLGVICLHSCNVHKTQIGYYEM